MQGMQFGKGMLTAGQGHWEQWALGAPFPTTILFSAPFPFVSLSFFPSFGHSSRAPLSARGVSAFSQGRGMCWQFLRVRPTSVSEMLIAGRAGWAGEEATSSTHVGTVLLSRGAG